MVPLEISEFETYLYFIDLGGELARMPRFQTSALMRYLQASEAERAALRDT